MFIVSKDGMALINTEQVSAIYISSETPNIRAETVNGKMWNIGRYDSKENAKSALGMLAERIRSGKDAVAFLPHDRDIQAVRAQEDQKYHHMTGKKTKGHGGS